MGVVFALLRVHQITRTNDCSLALTGLHGVVHAVDIVDVVELSRTGLHDFDNDSQKPWNKGKLGVPGLGSWLEAFFFSSGRVPRHVTGLRYSQMNW